MYVTPRISVNWVVLPVLKCVNYPVYVFIGHAIIGPSVPPILFFFCHDVLLVFGRDRDCKLMSS